MKRTNQNQGFTIVEMLTVMGIIAILIGLLLPALNQVKDYSRQIQQKAQFHSIDPGLEMYKNDFGSYPESKDNAIAPANTIDDTTYCGANKLAESMVGLDLLGFHPKSGFTASGENDVDGGALQLIYDPINGITGDGTPPYTETAAQNIDLRKKYIDLESANAFQMQDVYTSATATGGNFLATSFVLCDVYARKRASGKKAGMPILYFRARTNYQFQNYADALTYQDDIYNIYDNTSLLTLNSPEDATVEHPLWDATTDLKDFEDMILNKQVQNATQALGGVKRPYRVDSYILVSAGKDGLYGTADDIFNFEKSAEQ